MFDLKDLEERFDFYLAGWKRRGKPELLEIVNGLVDQLKKRKELIFNRDELLASRNRAADLIASKKKAGEDIAPFIAEQKEIGPKVKEAEAKLKTLEDDLGSLLSSLPNMPDTSVPEGADESSNKEVHRWGDHPQFDFEVISHEAFGEKKSWFNFERATQISGTRFSISYGVAAKLERALIQFMLDLHTTKNGYLEVQPPLIVNATTLYGTGNLPKFKDDLFHLETQNDYYLIPTAEAPLTNLHANEILSEEDLPKYYTAFTPCFRSEAGSYGKDMKGLIRQHQFNKVELVKLVHPDSSEAEHEKMRRDAENILEQLKLPYRTVVLSAGDMGFSAAKTYDLEVWLPSQNQYREISSVSNCKDFQARRMNTRFRSANSKPQFVHTLNGSGLAVGRTLIAILENYQTKEGDLILPEVLRPYFNGKEKV